MCTLSGSLSLFATACGLYGVPDAVRSSFARRISVAAEGTDGGLITVADCANGRDTPAHIRIARDGRGWRAVSQSQQRGRRHHALHGEAQRRHGDIIWDQRGAALQQLFCFALPPLAILTQTI